MKKFVQLSGIVLGFGILLAALSQVHSRSAAAASLQATSASVPVTVVNTPLPTREVSVLSPSKVACGSGITSSATQPFISCIYLIAAGQYAVQTVSATVDLPTGLRPLSLQIRGTINDQAQGDILSIPFVFLGTTSDGLDHYALAQALPWRFTQAQTGIFCGTELTGLPTGTSSALLNCYIQGYLVP